LAPAQKACMATIVYIAGQRDAIEFTVCCRHNSGRAKGCPNRKLPCLNGFLCRNYWIEFHIRAQRNLSLLSLRSDSD